MVQASASPKLRTALEAVRAVPDGGSIMVGGFGLCGCPHTLLEALLEAGKRDLTVISNNFGEPGRGLGKLLRARRVKRVVGSYFTTNREVVEAYRRGEVEVELLPQGTLAEAIRAGGAGIAAFYTPVGVGTVLQGNREVRVFDGREYVLQRAIRADVALIRAHKADPLGNLVYRKTARNFNPLMATAADYVVAEVDEIVPLGALSPEEVVTPHVFVDALVLSA